MSVRASMFVVAWLAMAGIPPFAGFWSKDDILLNAWDKSVWLWAVGVVAAVLTAYYMSRQVFLVFFGDRAGRRPSPGRRRRRRRSRSTNPRRPPGTAATT